MSKTFGIPVSSSRMEDYQSGDLDFVLCFTDLDYAVGDMVVLKEQTSEAMASSLPREMAMRVTYVYRGEDAPVGVTALGLEKVKNIGALQWWTNWG